MKLAIEKRGRPADTLIFQAELDKQIDLISELSKNPIVTPEKPKKTTQNIIKKIPKIRTKNSVLLKKTLINGSAKYGNS